MSGVPPKSRIIQNGSGSNARWQADAASHAGGKRIPSQFVLTAQETLFKPGSSFTSQVVADFSGQMKKRLNISFVIEGKPIIVEGLKARLGTIPFKEAYQAMVNIADGGYQEELVNIDLVEAVRFLNINPKVDGAKYVEICSLRQITQVLSQQVGLTIQADKSKPESVLSNMSLDELLLLVNNYQKLKGNDAKPLTQIITEWGQAFEFPPGLHQLGDIIELAR